MKVRQKLVLSFGVLTLLVGVVGYFSILLSSQVQGLRTTELPMEQSLREVEVGIWQTIGAANSFRLSGNGFYEDLYNQQIAIVEKSLSDYTDLTDTKEEERFLEDFWLLWNQAKTSGNELIRLSWELKSAENAFFVNVDEADDVIDFQIQGKWQKTAPDLLEKEQAIREVEVSIWEAIHAGQQFTGLSADIIRGGQKHLGGAREAAKRGAKASLVKGDFADLMERQFQDVQEYWTTYKALRLERFEEDAINEFDEYWGKAVSAGREVISLHQQAEGQFNTLFATIDRADDIVDLEMQDFILKRIESEDKKAKGIRVITTTIGVLAVIGAVVIGTLVSQSICRPIAKLRKAATKIGTGDLDTTIKIKSNDEIADLGSSFNKMTTDLRLSIDSLQKEIAQRKHAEDQLSREKAFTEASLNTIQDIFYVFDFEGKCLRWNQALSAVTGYSDREIAARTPADYFTGQGVQLIADSVDRIAQGNVVTVQAALITKDGRSIPFELTGARLTDPQDRPFAFCGIGRDISDRKRTEEALQKLNEDLSLTARKLEESNHELQNFAYIASHDLREPLRKISSFGGLLQDSLAGTLKEDDQENLHFMIDGAERMQEMIEGLLVYSRLERKDMVFDPVDLNQIIQQLQEFELAAPLSDSTGHIELTDPLPTVLGDDVQIRQLLQNLIANGLKYRPDDVVPQIRIWADQISNESVKIYVRDNGIGIPPESHQAVFSMFKRLNSRSKYQGSGIGLAVCKKIVQRHGGDIGVESQPGKGSTFWFTLPLCTASEIPESAQPLAANAE